MNDEHPIQPIDGRAEAADTPAQRAAAADTPAQRAADDERREGREGARLGTLLRDARERAGLGLSDLAEVTHVRRVYLSALEEGRYAELPEDVYARNFVRLYASAVGLDAAPLLERYHQERGRALGRTTLEQRLERDRAAASTPSPAAPRPTARQRPTWRVPAALTGPWLPTVALVAVVVALAVWGYNGLFAGGTPTSPATEAGGTAQPAQTEPAAPSPAPQASLAAPADGAVDAGVDPGLPVRVSIVTTPPGASISIDGFPVPGVTPLTDVPVTARAGRVVRAELDGYEPAEVRADVLGDVEVSLQLEPLGAPPAAAAPAGAGTGTLVITITDTTWLEVYRSLARNEGERLVFTTAQPGASYSFDPPVFVYTGNAAGVRLTLDGQDLGAMGSPGAVLGRAFPE